MNELMVIESVVVNGDLAALSPEQRLGYYKSVCESIGLNPLTKPFDYIRLNGKLTLYAKRDATDQLRKIHGVSVVITGRDRMEDVYIVTAKATTPDGRTDESTGVVSIGGLKGDSLANALMKAETKSKRRVTLSIVGLGWLDETELETIPGVMVGQDGVGQDGGPSFASLDDLLFQLNEDFGLTEADAKEKLKALGFTGWPKNGGAKRQSTAMYLAVKNAVAVAAGA